MAGCLLAPPLPDPLPPLTPLLPHHALYARPLAAL